MNVSNIKLGSKRAITMVEMLMVILIISLILSIMIPNINSQTDQSKIATTKSNLAMMRTAVQIYSEQENAWPDNSLARLHDGNSPSGTVYLPAIPIEAIMNSNVVTNSPDYTSGGWYYDVTNREVYINLSGVDANGDQYSEY